MSIAQNINHILKSIPTTVQLIAISKGKPPDAILEAYHCGQRIFGENKAQELQTKQETLPKDIQWHMIGHLQSNKVKQIAPFISMVHSVDSLKLLKEINKEAEKNKRIIRVLLQMHIAREQSKFGLTMEGIQALLSSEEYDGLKHTVVAGLMGMATFTNDMQIVREEFRFLATCFECIRQHYFSHDDNFKDISMGMSDDYLIAVEEGSTMIRVGSSIFGSRI